MMKRVLLFLAFVLLSSSVSFGQQQRRTVTNFDLEKFRDQRLQAEAAYDREARSGRLPSREELNRREEERQRFLSEYSRQAAIEQNQNDNYWQSQASALRTEIAALEAEIGYVRARLGEIPKPQTYYAVGYLPYSYTNFGGVGFPQFASFGMNKTGVYAGGVNFGATFGDKRRANVQVGIGQTTVRRQTRINVYGQPSTNVTFGGIPYQPGILTVPFTLPTPQNLTREELLSRLRTLEQTRAGLYARYEILIDEARRSGVNIN